MFFFSYNWGVQEEVKSVQNLIEKLGFEDFFFDIRNLNIGDELEPRLKSAINSSKVVLLFLTPEYLKSKNCNLELIEAFENGKPKIVPIIMKQCQNNDWPSGIEKYKEKISSKLYADFSKILINDLSIKINLLRN